MGNLNNPWGTYDSYRDCSQGVCSVYCPQWCYVIFPPPPSFFLDDEDDSSSSDFSPLLIALIGILASAFILVSYYTLISKYCHRRRDNSSSSSSTSPTAAINRDHNGISSDYTWQGNNNNNNNNGAIGGGDGLDESLIKSITVYKYRKMDGFVESSDCSVCLSEFQENESLRLLPKCNHAFHLPCIDTWLISHSNCPLCRAFIAGPVEILAVTNHPIESDEDFVVVNLDLENSTSRNETVSNGNGESTPKPPETHESRDGEEQVNRRSASLNSGAAVVSIADILREIEDEEESAGVGTSRRVEEREGEKTPPPSGSAANQTNGISNFLMRSVSTAILFFALVIMSSSANHISPSKNKEDKVMVRKGEDPRGFHPIECIDAIKSVEGCFETIGAIFKGHLHDIRHSCCKTLNGLSDNCWPILFPGKLYVRITIKLACLFSEMNDDLSKN